MSWFGLLPGPAAAQGASHSVSFKSQRLWASAVHEHDEHTQFQSLMRFIGRHRNPSARMLAACAFACLHVFGLTSS